jgi:hypothetical protein
VTETLHTEGTTIADTSATPGTIRKVDQVPTEAGNVRTVDRVVEPIDQESTSAIRSAAADTDIEEHTEGAEITDLTVPAGKIRRVDQAPTEAGNMKTRDALTTPKNQTSTSLEADHFKIVTEILNTEATGPTITTNAFADDGQAIRIEETPTEAGNIRRIERTESATFLRDKGSYPTRYGTVYWWIGINAHLSEYNEDLVEADLDNSTDNRVSRNRTRFANRYDYTIVKSPVSAATYLWSESILGPKTKEDIQYAHIWSATYGRVRRYKRLVTITYYVKIANSLDSAIDYIDGGKEGSHWAGHGEGRYLGTKVTAISEGDWTLDETGVT